MTDTINFSRRNLLKGGGALLIGFSLAGAGVEEAASTTRAAFAAPRDLKQVDSWIAINADNTATLFLGKSELGQGITTGLLQIAGEELDLGMNQMSAALLDTYMSPRQAPTVASLGITQGGPQIRAAAAEARQALLALAAAKLEVPASELSVANGVVSVKSDARRAVKYGELLGDKPFNVAFTGKAPVKPVSEYQLVGKPVARVDLPAKIRGTYTYMQHVRVPNMLHGRVVRPQGQGAYGADAKVVSIDESSIKDIVGAKVVRKGNFVGVVAPTEWDSVQAAHKLKVQWDAPGILPGNGGVHAKMRSDTTIDTVVDQAGDIDAAFGSAAHVVAGTFQAPYQAQAPFGPNCALADVSADKALVMCSTQDVFKTAELVAKVVGLTPQQVRVQYYEGSGTFGHSAYHDVAQAAAIMSQEIGKPVRVQLMRADEHGYGNYGPAQLSDVRAAVDANGKLVAFEFQSWQHCWIDNETSELLALGTKAKERTGRLSMTVRPTICSMYDVASRKLINHQVSGLAGYLRGSYLRSPLDTGFCFAAEQMIDEVALAAGIDPLEFRRKNMRDPRWIAVLNAAGEAAKWVPRPTRERPMRDVMTGSGVAVGGHYADNYAAAVAEVEVNRATGKVVVKKIFGAMDTGLAINPAVVETQMIGMMTQATSRVLKEEVTFSNTNVTSLDWNSYPILRFSEHPTVTPILLQRLEQPPAGAGENLMGPTAAAIANAFFDATGIRMKEYPLTPERVKAALTRRA
jgi:CO/xanthine dehydrogenase Mo-binding subunit